MPNTNASKPLNKLIGNSDAIKQAKQMIKLVAPTDARVLITGETGTGKTMMANIIHELHPARKKHEFRRTNIGALVPTLAQSQLYGHVPNAFTGALKKSDGIILESNKGTLFLDEIATAHPEVQIMLLNLLEIPVVNPVGGGIKDRKPVDIRIIAATTKSPDKLLNLDTFRTELFFRISEYVIELKPLRERIEDIKPLASHFIKTNNKKIRCPPVILDNGEISEPLPKLEDIEPEALKKLEGYNWPGNVRELEHVIRAAMVESREDPQAKVLTAEWIKFPTYELKPKDAKAKTSHVNVHEGYDKNILFSWDINSADNGNGSSQIALKDHLDYFRSGICNEVLKKNHNNQALAARILGIDAGSLAKYKQFEPSDVPGPEASDGDTFCSVYVVKR